MRFHFRPSFGVHLDQFVSVLRVHTTEERSQALATLVLRVTTVAVDTPCKDAIGDHIALLSLFMHIIYPAAIDAVHSGLSIDLADHFFLAADQADQPEDSCVPPTAHCLPWQSVRLLSRWPCAP
jgi:hypothetical protein